MFSPVTSYFVRHAVLLGVALTSLTLLARDADQAPPCDANNAGLTLPNGFCATLFADSLGAARHLVVASNGDVLVNARATRSPNPNTPGNPGGLYILRDADGDGKAEVKQRAADAVGTGIALANGYVYAT